MTRSRVAPRPHGPSTATPSASGPRWRRVPTMRSTTSRSASSPAGASTPAIPHIAPPSKLGSENLGRRHGAATASGPTRKREGEKSDAPQSDFGEPLHEADSD